MTHKQKFNYTNTRLHSSRMQTACTLTETPSMLCSGGVYLVPEGVLSPQVGCT